MQKNGLYINIVDATANIVKQFGRITVHEERFVNILSDMYPERDNPAIYKIIRSAIQDGLLTGILSANAKSIEHQVASATSALTKQYGYDQSLVEGIMFSLAIGYGTISTTQYNALKAQKNKPVQKQVLPPSQKNNQNRQKPTKNTTKPIKKTKIDGTIVKSVIFLIWGILGLTISPLLYLYGVAESDGICFAGTLYVAILHLFTLVPIAVVIDGHPSIGNPKTYPSIAGAMYGLMICAIIFWVVFPILFGFQFILDIWGLSIKDPFPWITSFLANIFCAGILGSYLEEIERFSGISTNNKNKFFFINSQLYSSRPFKRGFIIVVSYFLLVGLIAIFAPTISRTIDKLNIYRINRYIDDVNEQKARLRSQREKDNRKLGFAQFSLDDSFIVTVSKIKNNDVFTVEKTSTYSESLYIHNDNYITIVDSIISLNTQWNNEKITLEMFFVKDKLAALRYSPLQTQGDSIVSIYTAKYGEPEYELKKYVYITDDYPRYMPAENSEEEYIFSSGNLDKDDLYPDSYYWTYKNSLIKIDNERNKELYEYRKSATITYFSRRIEPVLKRKKEMEDAIKKEIDKKRNDSIKRVRETKRLRQLEEERRIQEQKRQEELNHKRSIEQI